ncbi:hypothetical protein BC940DRAFT_337858 [Gongronella butleri]|nr:hypothetical protein BC940DRAFT_337858 [Gongronella butleri]
MPMSKDVASIHNQLVEIAQDAHRTAHSTYNADDVLKLQRRLSTVDTQFQNGKLDTRYEEPGVCQVSKELDQVHHNVHSMLARVASDDEGEKGHHTQ